MATLNNENNRHDAFSNAPVSQYSVAYEKACIIFNIASTCSSIAALQNRFEASGLKAACNYFQVAAGLYSYISENFLHAPSVDMSRDSIRALTDLSLAQAQECFIEKAVMEKKKPALIAKLAAHAAHGYSATMDGLSNEDIKTQFDKQWLELIKVKAKHFAALACFHKAQALELDSKYGECVAHFQRSEKLAKEAVDAAKVFAKAFPNWTCQSVGSTSTNVQGGTSAAAALTESMHFLYSLACEKVKQAVKDNDMIYHDIVPHMETLPAVEKLAAVKPCPFADILPNGPADIPKIIGPDIFKKLIPLSVHEAASCYSEEKAKILRTESDACTNADTEFTSLIDGTDLLPLLLKLKQSLRPTSGGSSDFPDEIALWVNEARSVNDVDASESKRGLDAFKLRVRESFDQIAQLLDQENLESENLRVRVFTRG